MKLNYKFFFFTIVATIGLMACFTLPHKSSTTAEGGIQWLTIEEAAAKEKKNPKKVFIDVYTDWCGWCKKMDRDTFSDPKIAAYINKNYYAVKLDAEGKAPITLNGKTYQYDANRKAHELAIELLQGRMGYPTTVYLDEKFNMLSPQPGYLTVPQFDKIIRFYAENHYQTKSFEQFEKEYKASK